jgi:hypothetical protein
MESSHNQIIYRTIRANENDVLEQY